MSFIAANIVATSSQSGGSLMLSPSYFSGSPCGSYSGGKMTPLCSSVCHFSPPRAHTTCSSFSNHFLPSSVEASAVTDLLLLPFSLAFGEAFGAALAFGVGFDFFFGSSS